MANKVEEVLEQRAKCRERLLALKAESGAAASKRDQLNAKLVELSVAIKREQSKLIEITADAAKLLHADLSGIVGGEKQSQPPAAGTAALDVT